MPCGPARLLKQETAEIRDGAKYFINAGSVGQPRDGNPRACGIVLDTDRGTITFHRIAYDVSAVQRKIRAAGLPAFLADRLDIGR
jgi:diadenosine tetraphosphatase ApaH/serine/threonine PP2A family protein phosphatase